MDQFLLSIYYVTYIGSHLIQRLLYFLPILSFYQVDIQKFQIGMHKWQYKIFKNRSVKYLFRFGLE